MEYRNRERQTESRIPEFWGTRMEYKSGIQEFERHQIEGETESAEKQNRQTESRGKQNQEAENSESVSQDTHCDAASINLA